MHVDLKAILQTIDSTLKPIAPLTQTKIDDTVVLVCDWALAHDDVIGWLQYLIGGGATTVSLADLDAAPPAVQAVRGKIGDGAILAGLAKLMPYLIQLLPLFVKVAA